jgi:hypothetical protein
VKSLLVLLCGAWLAVAARARPVSPPAPETVVAQAVWLHGLIHGTTDSPSLADVIVALDREADPRPLLELRADLARVHEEANRSYQPAILALINACDTALQLHTYLQEETPALRAAIPRYQEAVAALNGFPPVNAVDAAILRTWQSEALAAQQFYRRAEGLRASALQACQSAAAAKTQADQDLANP